ncbi:MAG: O-antigen ligase family protein [Candidatus Aminicenantes bacterium]|nr:MAG: O-antigen ligase family protein [Candidatus Aminicenantes bacterium]
MIELIYSLFLLSGLIKSFIIIYADSLHVIDFTLLCALFLLGIYVLHFGKNFFFKNTFYVTHKSKAIIFCVFVLYSWMIITLVYTPSPEYCYIKVFMFLTDLLALLFPFIYRKFNPERFFHIFVYLGSSLVFIYSALLPDVYANYLRYSEYREFVVKYLDIGYLSGIVILMLAFTCPRIKPLPRILLIGTNAWTLVISSARGPLVFLFIVLMIRFVVVSIRFLKKWKLNLKNILYTIGAIGLLGAAVVYLIDKYALFLERSIFRLSLLADPQSGGVAKRLSLIYFSLDKIFENAVNFLFGLGIGSFGILYDGVDERNYPHNVILEIWFELGILGVAMFALLLFIYFKKVRFNLNFVLIFGYLLLNGLKSYSLADSLIMYGILSVLVLSSILLKPNGQGKEDFDEQF